MQTMGERLKLRRRALKRTQAGLAQEAGVGLATVRRIEQGASEPRMDTARRLAATLGVRAGWLVGGEEPMVGGAPTAKEERV